LVTATVYKLHVVLLSGGDVHKGAKSQEMNNTTNPFYSET